MRFDDIDDLLSNLEEGTPSYVDDAIREFFERTIAETITKVLGPHENIE